MNREPVVLSSDFKHYTASIHSKYTRYLEFHASGACKPVVEAQHNDAGHQGSHDKGRRLHAATPISQSHHLKIRAEDLPNKNTLSFHTKITIPKADHREATSRER